MIFKNRSTQESPPQIVTLNGKRYEAHTDDRGEPQLRRIYDEPEPSAWVKLEDVPDHSIVMVCHIKQNSISAISNPMNPDGNMWSSERERLVFIPPTKLPTEEIES